MEVRAVKQHIKDKHFDKFYIFTGPEIQIQNIYINKISQVSGLTVSRMNSIADIYRTKRTVSFVNKRYCYIVRDDKDFMKNENAWKTVDKMVGDNMLILLVTQLDKRNKFYKHFSDKIVTFDYLEIPVLVRYIQKEIPLSDTNATVLAQLCEQDYARILLEIDKIKHYCTAIGTNSAMADMADKAFTTLLDSGDIYQPPKDAIFEFVDAVLQRKPRKAFDLLQDCKDIGEASLVMQSVLYTQFKHLLQYQSCTSNDVTKSTGLSGWDIKLVKDKKGKYSTGDLVYIIKLLRTIEKNIKIGKIEDSVCIDYALVNIL